MPRTSGYSAAQIALHWAVVVLVAAQYVFKGTIAAAWDAIAAGRAVGCACLRRQTGIRKIACRLGQVLRLVLQ